MRRHFPLHGVRGGPSQPLAWAPIWRPEGPDGIECDVFAGQRYLMSRPPRIPIPAPRFLRTAGKPLPNIWSEQQPGGMYICIAVPHTPSHPSITIMFHTRPLFLGLEDYAGGFFQMAVLATPD